MPKVHKASDPTCKRENCQDQGCKCEKQHHVFGRGSSKKTVSKKYDDSGKQVCDYGQMADLFLLAKLEYLGRMGLLLTITNNIRGLCSLRTKYTPKDRKIVSPGKIDMVKPNSGSMKWTSIKPYCRTKQMMKKASSLTRTT